MGKGLLASLIQENTNLHIFWKGEVIGSTPKQFIAIILISKLVKPNVEIPLYSILVVVARPTRFYHEMPQLVGKEEFTETIILILSMSLQTLSEMSNLTVPNLMFYFTTKR